MDEQYEHSQALGRPPASILRRVLASFIDVLAWAVPGALLMVALLYLIHSTPREQCGIDACAMAAMSVIFGIPMLATPVVGLGYLAVQIVGMSPGMLVTSIKIVDETGRLPGWRGLVRFVMPLPFFWTPIFVGVRIFEATFDGNPTRTYTVAVGALIAALPYLWALWQPERRTLHDLAAGTWVVRRVPQAALTAPIEEPVPSTM